ncbi:hypothetical protein [Streptomyces rubradiris]|uniref:Uncharacterized protein n=1 Tax=Streptomyces rubradiris TaxID=285531 RepID=A0ABQ3R7I4_STRRR|nr:hypothetical protein [Streptomyces rubradiris]GHH16505.1 hypothetical protein GCM10018792_46270 [Streptomyces rubradiris]GHI51807.1 hypothetical protein Srubr_16530 [Streptomyces rubradiris]
MGWAVLYIAFGGVALWLLGEVLLQYKARLRWRLLAFTGFLGVVIGVLLPSVIVIALGAIAFAVGQTYVTLSFRRGFASGWAVRRPGPQAGGGGSKRRRGRAGRKDPAARDTAPAVPEAAPAFPGAAQEPYVPDLEGYTPDQVTYGPAQASGDFDDDHDDVFTPAAPRPAEPAAAETTAVHAPQPAPGDTGGYGGYGTPGHPAPDPQAPAYGYTGYGAQDYGYDTADGRQGYANYSDPYIGSRPYAAYDHDPAGQYGQQPGHPQDPYAPAGYPETPPGGVWVPQQRTDDGHGGELPPEQPYPRQPGGAGYDEQYRF